FALISDIFSHASIAMADLTLTFFYTISTIFLFYYFTTKKRYYLLYSSIFMGFMAWSKEEGFGLLFVNTAVFVIYNIFLHVKKIINYKKNRLNKEQIIHISGNESVINVLAFFTIGFLIYLPWLITCFINNFTTSYLTNIRQIFDLKTTFTNLIDISYYFFVIHPVGIVFWIIFFLFIIFNIRFVLKENNFFLLTLSLFHFFLYLLIYLVTPYDLSWHLRFSADRLLMHLTPICTFLIGILLSNNKNNLIVIQKEKNKGLYILGYLILIGIILFIIIDIFFFELISDALNMFPLLILT
ncbi:hypothetical protein LCGC14_2403600, partial [marine sediment metagenome]